MSPPTPLSYSIVRVTPENATTSIPSLLSLIHELALYEDAPEQVFATPELLRKNLFGEGGGRSYAEAALVYVNKEGETPQTVGEEEEKRECVAMAVWFYTFSTWTGKGGIYLEDLYVTLPYRSKGIGSALFKLLGKICKEEDLPRLDWVVLDVNYSAKEVYKKMGAREKTEWEGLRLEGEGLEKMGRD